MSEDRRPAERHLELLLAFARVPPASAEYEAIARERGLRVVEERLAPEYRLFKGEQFGLMLVDGKLARLHAAALFESDDEEGDEEALGIEVVTSLQALDDIYRRLLARLTDALGVPSRAGSWSANVYLGFDDAGQNRRESHEFRYVAWELGRALLVLLMNDEGDAHIGEQATVDLRIAPREAGGDLPGSVQELFAWPVEY